MLTDAAEVKHMPWPFGQLTGIPVIIPAQKHGKNFYQETQGKSPPWYHHQQKPATCADILQRVEQWETQENASICSWKMPSRYSDQCLRSGRLQVKMKKKKLQQQQVQRFFFCFLGGVSHPPKRVIAGGCGARGLIRWPCGLTITQALSCLSRLASGNSVIEKQQIQTTVLVKTLPWAWICIY